MNSYQRPHLPSSESSHRKIFNGVAIYGMLSPDSTDRILSLRAACLHTHPLSALILTSPRLVHLFLFDIATSLTKLSMLAMVRRLTAASNNKIENIIVLALAALITVNCFIFIMVEAFQCRYVLHSLPTYIYLHTFQNQ